jgi:hypothetical protein
MDSRQKTYRWKQVNRKLYELDSMTEMVLEKSTEKKQYKGPIETMKKITL